jgi:TrmH family RNA methyltransferase
MNTKLITSVNNNWVKEVSLLKSNKGRFDYNAFWIEGVKLLREALNSSLQFKEIVIAKDLFTKEAEILFGEIINYFPITEASENVFKKISDTQSPQGIGAIIELPQYEVHNVVKNKFILIIDGVQDPGNFGTIIRTAEAFNVEGIITTLGTVDYLNPKAIRAGMGSVFRMKIVKDMKVRDIINILKENSFRIAVSSPRGKENLKKCHWEYPLALVLGSETAGAEDEFFKYADNTFHIPISNKVESLNVSIAASIMLYEIAASHLL